MAAQALAVRKPGGPAACWARLFEELQVRVRDYNVTAGENVWRISRSDAPRPRLTLVFTAFPECRLDCVCDAEHGLVITAPGAAGDSTVTRLPFSRNGLLYNGEDRSVAYVASQLLDGLAHAIQE
jgi:hypothetical protein